MAATIREAKEEVGVDILNPVLIGQDESRFEHKRDTVETFWCIASNQGFKIDQIEIKEAGWFTRENLPIDRMSRVDKTLAHYDQYKNKLVK